MKKKKYSRNLLIKYIKEHQIAIEYGIALYFDMLTIE
jgi:hypothetical protein